MSLVILLRCAVSLLRCAALTVLLRCAVSLAVLLKSRRLVDHRVVGYRLTGHVMQSRHVIGHPVEMHRLADHSVEVLCLLALLVEMHRLADCAVKVPHSADHSVEAYHLIGHPVKVLWRCAVLLTIVWRCAVLLLRFSVLSPLLWSCAVPLTVMFRASLLASGSFDFGVDCCWVLVSHDGLLTGWFDGMRGSMGDGVLWRCAVPCSAVQCRAVPCNTQRQIAIEKDGETRRSVSNEKRRME